MLGVLSAVRVENETPPTNYTYEVLSSSNNDEFSSELVNVGIFSQPYTRHTPQKLLCISKMLHRMNPIIT